MDEYVQQKVDAMTRIAEGAEGTKPDFAVMVGLEKYREIPFEAKTQPEAARKILEIYTTRVKPKLRGEAAVQMAGEMKLLENQMK